MNFFNTSSTRRLREPLLKRWISIVKDLIAEAPNALPQQAPILIPIKVSHRRA
jgi:hypothetical protein